MKYSREGILSHWPIWIQIGEFTYEAEYLESDDASYNQIVAESGGVLKVSGSGVGNYYDRNCLCLPLCF